MRATDLLRLSAMTVSLVACGPESRDAADEPVTDYASACGASEVTTSRVRGVATFTAADVTRMLMVSDEAAIARANLALDRATILEVKRYAERMIEERKARLLRLVAIADGVRARTVDPTSRLFEREALREREALEALEGPDFELAFMTAELSSHARMLGLVEVSLLPSVSFSTRGDDDARELEHEVEAVRAATAEHLAHALSVQGVLRAARAGDGPAPDLPRDPRAPADALRQ